jgi:predicted transcriptional regulator
MADTDFPSRLKEWIGKRRVEEAAATARVSRATLYNLLGGGEPRMATLRKLKDAGVSIPRNLLAP